MSSERALRQAVNHQQAGRVREALRLYENILAAEPEHPHALRRALDILPESAEGHNDLGIVLRRAGKLAQATTAYRSALAVDPTYAQAHANLGNA